MDDATAAVQRAAAGDADGLGVGRVQAVALSHGFHFGEDAGDGFVHAGGGELDFVRDLQDTVSVNAVDDGAFRAADIDAEQVLFHISTRLLR